MSNFFKSNDTGILIIRLTVGLLLLPHGISKLINGIDWLGESLTKVGLPAIIRYGVFIGEIIAPLLLVIGYRTRIASLIVAFNMFMTIFLAKRDQLFVIRGGWAIELNALFLLGALALFFTGGGKYCVSTKNKWD
jgi:putative oxidoreductase